MKDHKAVALKLFDKMEYVYPGDVVKACGCPPPSARRILAALVSHGDIVRVRKGCFKKVDLSR